jgi:hypothetical protein
MRHRGCGGSARQLRGKAVLIAFSALFTLGGARTALAADAVVGSGTAGSCTEAALNSAVATVTVSGGTITFNCGSAPATINLTTQKTFNNASATYAIDGGGLITLDGQNLNRILFHLGGTLNVRNITLSHGRASGLNDNGSGGAIRSDNGSGNLVLNLTNVTFANNATNLTGVTDTFNGVPLSTFDYGGAAVYTRLGRLTVTNCTFNNNTANNSSGGAIHGRSSTIAVTGSTFTANASNAGGFGGAIYVDGVSPPPTATGGTIQVSTSTFSNNTAYNIGGAFYFFLYTAKNESATIDTDSFLGNQVVENSGTIPFVGTRGIGGAGVVDAGDVTILRSTFANNRARSSTGGGSGGGLSLTSNDSIQITNSTFSANRAEGTNSDASGGGLVIYNNSLPFQITNSTIASNYAGWTGGGIQSNTNGVLTNTVVANNTADNGGNPWQIEFQCSSQLSNGGGVLHFPNIVGSPSAQNPLCAAGATVADPRLSPLAANGGFAATHALMAGSPAIDSGSCVVSTDERGVARPQGPGCDIGAYEASVPATQLNVDGPPNGTGVGSSFLVGGWALDPAAGPGSGPGVNLVSVHNGTTCAASILAQAAPSLARADVRAFFGLDASYTNSGFSLSVTPPVFGLFTYTVCARSAIDNQYHASTTRTVRISSPLMNVDGPGQGATVPLTFAVGGWALDRGAAAGPGVDLVRIFQGATCSGTVLTDATLGGSRPDVQAAFGLSPSFANSGFTATITLPSGAQQFTACARSTVTGAFAAQMTRSLTVSDTRLNVDGPANGAGVLQPFAIGGWAFDAAAASGPGVDLVRIFAGSGCGGTAVADATLGLSRPDVRAFFGLPPSFNNTGFSATVTLPGIGLQTYTVCAHSTVTGTFAAQSTRTVRVANTLMNVDGPGAGASVGTTFAVGGWAFDNGAGQSGPGVDLVQIFQGGTCSGTVLATATLGISRSDVQSFFGLPASYQSTGFTASVSASPGSLTFTACARSTVTGTFTRSVTRTVTVN